MRIEWCQVGARCLLLKERFILRASVRRQLGENQCLGKLIPVAVGKVDGRCNHLVAHKGSRNNSC